MDLYILDSLLRRTEVVDKYESLIWTERFADLGEFELNLVSTRQSRAQFLQGTMLAINNSYRVMVVDTTEDRIDADGKRMLNVKGWSLEGILKDRTAKDTMSNLTVEPQWVITATPANVARTMFNDICRTGNLDLADLIPFLQPGTILPASNIPEPATPITWRQDPDELFNAIKAVCDPYDLGFRLVRNFDTSQLYFDIYSGSDRTTKQALLPPVIFAPGFDNLQNTSEFKTTRGSKNVAYVFSEAGFREVYPDGVNPDDVVGFDRHVLMVNASDVTAETVNIAGALLQAGQEALLQNRSLSAFDGELDQNSQYKYGTDYNLGDLVELRNEDGEITDRRVSEQIFVRDVEGERSYPTLTANDFILAGTWLTAGDDVWADMLDEHWADM